MCVQYVCEMLCLREGSLQRQQQFSNREKTDYCPHTLTLKASLQAVRMPVWFQICSEGIGNTACTKHRYKQRGKGRQCPSMTQRQTAVEENKPWE